jgi:DNA transposition AAA+ family ATPase
MDTGTDATVGINEHEEQARISIPGDTVQTALTRLVTHGELQEDGKAQIWWFFGHCRDKGMTLADAGKAIDRDATTVHRLFNGRYGAAYTNIVAEIARYRKIADERAKRKEIGFIETTTWRKVSIVCRGALYDSMPAYIYGSSQIGKTACLEEYARRNNHGQTRYIRMPAAPTFRDVLALVAEACFISERHKTMDLRRRIFHAVDDRALLIFDEFHQVFIGASDLTARKVVEFIREIYDRTHCGIVICGTRVIQEEFERGRQKLVWEQFRRRGMVELVLPDLPPKADILKIAAAFGLFDPDATTMETIRDMLMRSGIGMYFKFLQLAHSVAVSKQETLTWAHFMQTFKNMQSLSRG